MKPYIQDFKIDNCQCLQDSPDGVGSTCEEAFENALDDIATGDDERAKVIQGLSDSQVTDIWTDYLDKYPDDITILNKEMEKLMEDCSEDSLVEVHIYCYLLWEE